MNFKIAWVGMLFVSAALLRCGTPTLGDEPQGALYGTRAIGFVSVDERDPNSNNVLMGSEEVRDDPGTLVEYRTRDNLGKSFDFRITGQITEARTGSVWGTEIYTDDSPLAAAAVHAGLVQPGETAVVRVTILPGRNSYRGEVRQGVTSSQYGDWHGSYMIDSVAQPPQAEAFPLAPENLLGVEGDVGAAFVYRATGETQGNVWGTDIYTADSSLAAAAVHAGVLEAGQTGLIKVTILPGRTFYNGVHRHGVSSSLWGQYGRSFMVDRVSSGSFHWDSRTPVPGELERRLRDQQGILRPSPIR